MPYNVSLLPQRDEYLKMMTFVTKTAKEQTSALKRSCSKRILERMELQRLYRHLKTSLYLQGCRRIMKCDQLPQEKTRQSVGWAWLDWSEIHPFTRADSGSRCSIEQGRAVPSTIGNWDYGRIRQCHQKLSRTSEHYSRAVFMAAMAYEVGRAISH